MKFTSILCCSSVPHEEKENEEIKQKDCTNRHASIYNIKIATGINNLTEYDGTCIAFKNNTYRKHQINSLLKMIGASNEQIEKCIYIIKNDEHNNKEYMDTLSPSLVYCILIIKNCDRTTNETKYIYNNKQPDIELP